MSIMQPPVISPDVKSTAEKRIFEWFKNAPGTDNWIVLHSLGIAAHNKVIYGETDFLVLAPNLGVFALEVKGGRVRRENGKWYFTDRYGHENSKSRGPYDQAKDGIFSIVESIKSRLDAPHQHLKNIFFGYGVMFPDIEYNISGIDEEQWQVFDCRNERNVKKFIEDLSKNAQKKWVDTYGFFDRKKLPKAPDIQYLSSILRGDFDFKISISAQLQNSKEALLKLTQEQYRCLDQLEDNPRCLILGAAGTGKTILAIEEAKKSVAQGKKTALFCYNSLLADWFSFIFETSTPTLRPAFIGTFHKYMAQIAKDANLPYFPKSDEDNDDFYEKKLPDSVLNVLLEQDGCFDKIIIDEAQDLISSSYLDIIDCSLKKGINRGCWTMFGDFSMQAIYCNVKDGNELIEVLEDRATFIRFKLNVNCRNTKPICVEIQTITGVKNPKDLWLKVDGMPVQYITWKSTEDEAIQLDNLLDKLYRSGVAPESITILSSKKKEDSVVSALNRKDIHNYKVSQNQYTTFSTIQSFKGLENTVVIVVDVEDFAAEKLMYVALSRACAGLYVFESESAKEEYNSLLFKRLTNG